jgi:integrase
MLDGRRYRGSCKTEDKKLAESIADTIKADIIRKKHNLPRAINYQFQDLWDSYLQSQVTSKETQKVKKWISKHFLPVFKDKNIQNIMAADIKNYQLTRKLEVMSMPKNIGKRESDISFAYLNKEILILSNLFNFCIEKGLLEKNPAFKIKKLNELSRIKTLSDEDINKLIAGATNKLTRDLITFLIYTGCRNDEAV